MPQRTDLSATKQALLDKWIRGGAAFSPIVPKARTDGTIPLSFVQERQLFLELLDPSTAINNLAICVRLRGLLDLETFQESAARILARHEVLGTSFEITAGHPVARIASLRTMTVDVIDLERHAGDRLAEALTLAEREAQRPFDITRPLLMRVKLFRLAPDSHVLLIVVHHTIADGWSLGVFLRELFAWYGALTATPPRTLPPLPLQYADFAAWQRASIHEPRVEAQMQFWKQRLGGELPILDLPIDRPRSARQTFAGGTVQFRVPAAVMDGVRAISRQHAATPFMPLAAAVQSVLHRYCGQDDVLIGTPTAGRTRPETEELIGPFINTLVLRTDLSGDPTFAELLVRVREVAVSAYANQDVPFEKLVAELKPQRDLSRTPIFQVAFVFHNSPLPSIDIPGFSIELLGLDRGAALFDLTVTLTESPDGLDGACEYNSDLFDRSTIERISRSFQLLLADALARPDKRISRLQLMPDAEHRWLAIERNATHAPFPDGRCIHELVEAQAERTPDAVAVICGDLSLTYGELDRRADQLAGELQRAGVEPDARVGVCLERSPEIVVALLAVLKAGAAYVPMDAASPAERLRFVISDAAVRVVVTDTSLQSFGGIDAIVIRPSTVPAGGHSHTPSAALHRRAHSRNLAYVIYTSGSTGQPKGVCIAHRAVVNLLCSMQQLLGFRPGEALLAVTSIAFDIAALEIFLPLISGGTVVLATRDMTTDPRWLQSAIRRHRVRVIQATPTMWRVMLRGEWGREGELTALSGGEPLTFELARELLDRAGSVWNMYGPTETTIWSAAGQVERAPGPITIGRPLANTQLYVLDGRRQLAPVGATGELHIGGDGVSPGYLNRPELTAEKFIPNPFAVVGQEGSLLFRTGDRARYLPDGRIELLGRIDDQVKVNGFRIELGEVESALRRCQAVRQVAVTARQIGNRGVQLVAYIVPARESGASSAELREHVRNILPAYMVPSAFVLLPELPVTITGKVDRGRLPEVVVAAVSAGYVAPRTPLEASLAAIYAEVLGAGTIGVDDNFFDLGGGSIQILEIIARAQGLGLALAPLAFFEHQTVSAIASFVDKRDGGPADGIGEAVR